MMMKMAGIDCGPCRSPLTSLTINEITQMEKELKAAGFFNLLVNQKEVK